MAGATAVAATTLLGAVVGLAGAVTLAAVSAFLLLPTFALAAAAAPTVDRAALLLADLAVVVGPRAGAGQHRLVADPGPRPDVVGNAELPREAAVVVGR